MDKRWEESEETKLQLSLLLCVAAPPFFFRGSGIRERPTTETERSIYSVTPFPKNYAKAFFQGASPGNFNDWDREERL